MTAGAPDASGEVIDLLTLAQRGAAGTAWAYGGAQLNANLLVFEEGEGVATHVNNAVDVLLVGILGQGVITVDGQEHHVCAGQALVLAKDTRRAIRAVGGRFAYLTCHQRRPGLWPEGVPRPEANPETP